MKRNIVEYEGGIPPAILEGKIRYNDYYTPNQIRELISDHFPQKGEDKFFGLDFICISIIESFSAGRKSFDDLIEDHDTREDILKKALPSFKELGTRDIKVEIVELPLYENLKRGTSERYAQHFTTLIIEPLGYVFFSQSRMSPYGEGCFEAYSKNSD